MSETGAIRRTVHACVQCRARKTKCGGVTEQATCVACSSRKASCSFEAEARDPRFNPYLRVQAIGPSGRHHEADRAPDNELQSQLRQLRTELDALRAQQDRRVYSHGDGQIPISSLDNIDPAWNQRPGATEMPTHFAVRPGDQQYEANWSSEHQLLKSFPDSLEAAAYQGSSALAPSAPPQDQVVHSSTDDAAQLFDRPSSVTSAPAQTHHASVSQPSPDTPFNGPMRVLQDLGANDGFDTENHDPVSRQIITMGEASMAHKTFFSHCHINAPFLDPVYDADLTSVRSRSMALFLNIIVVAARFWSHKSRRDSWLHPRYTRLVALLDSEMSRLTLRPRPADIRLETVQAWMIYSHWMPVDVHTTPSGQSHRSRFSESSVWQCLGLAVRWATLLGLDQTAHLPVLDEKKKPSRDEIRSYRTMLYLTESDHYLALSARRPSTINPVPICQALPRYLRGEWAVATDARLASLMRVVEASYVMGARAESEESLEAFNMDVNEIERLFLAESPVDDKMGQHFPFTSLRWYRLTFASTLLPAMCNWNNAGDSLRLSIDWASQILYHLSSAATRTTFHLSPGSIEDTLEPDGVLVALLSFAIDQYFVVITYTAAFLVLAWQNGAIDNELRTHNGRDTAPAQSCTLYRLVDLASRTLRQCAPSRGHPATRYADFLTGMTSLIIAGPIIPPGRTAAQPAAENGPTIWDQDWLNLWQDSGLDQDWLFGPAVEET